MAGLVPTADPKPVRMRPDSSINTLDAVAIKIQPMQQGMAANLMVFKRPMYSMRKPENMHPTGTDRTMTDATHDDSVLVSLRSLSGSSTCGIKMAEKANEMPITM